MRKIALFSSFKNLNHYLSIMKLQTVF